MATNRSGAFEWLESETDFDGLAPSELKAVRITSTFETGHAGGFGGLTANVDGQGLSFGLMNWTINAGSLIPLLQEFIKKHGDRYARIFGRDAAAFREMVFATKRDPKTGAAERDVAAQMAFVRQKMNDAAQRHIVEPWKTYFRGLETDAEFRRIEVAAARRGLAHAKRWWQRFGFKSERAFVFMFDLVSSHGTWWLNAPKFGGAREKALATRTEQKRSQLGRALTERETLEVIANLIADLSLARWREQVRVRKLWFVSGKGKVHGTTYDLAKDFGVTDAPAQLGAASSGSGAPKSTTAPTQTPAPAPKTTTAPAPKSAPAPAPTTKPKPTVDAPAPDEIAFGLDTASVGGNKQPDWARARSAGGISFAIIRGAWGTWKDPVFDRDWPQMKAAGIVRGAYLFLRFPHHKYTSCPSPVAQAKAFILAVGKLEKTDFPPSLDVEFPGGRAETKMEPVQCLDGVRAAWRVLKDHYGVAPLIYTSARVWHEDLRDLPARDLFESPLWLARYPFKKGKVVRDPKVFAGGRHNPPVPPPWGDATNWWIHQYQGDAVALPGFPTGNIDMNRLAVTKPGAVGDRVRWVQRRLGVTVNGTFDAATTAALRSFQSKAGVPVASAIDAQTFASLCWSRP
jgi:GH25 family lysozyme M1 (1,4-beta-N-acetylmuramidase)